MHTRWCVIPSYVISMQHIMRVFSRCVCRYQDGQGWDGGGKVQKPIAPKLLAKSASVRGFFLDNYRKYACFMLLCCESRFMHHAYMCCVCVYMRGFYLGIPWSSLRETYVRSSI